MFSAGCFYLNSLNGRNLQSTKPSICDNKLVIYHHKNSNMRDAYPSSWLDTHFNFTQNYALNKYSVILTTSFYDMNQKI